MSTQFAPIWNNASVDFSCIKANVTDTNSGSNSTLLDLLVGGSSKFKVSKAGVASAYSSFALTFKDTSIYHTGLYDNDLLINIVGGPRLYYNHGYGWRTSANYYFGWSNGDWNAATSADLTLYRDASATLAQRNGTNAQAFRIYKTYTDATNNFERGKIAWESDVFRIGTEKGLLAGSARALELQTDGTTRLTISQTGLITINSSGGLQFPSTGYGIFWASSTTFRNRSDGVLTLSNYAENDFGRLQLGGTTSSFPAIKRNGTAINFRLADDSADCDITAAALTLSGNLTISTKNIVTDTTTGTKIGTATNQKIGFYNATPVVQPTAVADATDAASVITQLNALLSRMRDIGLIAT